jgi:hypothetical protein
MNTAHSVLTLSLMGMLTALLLACPLLAAELVVKPAPLQPGMHQVIGVGASREVKTIAAAARLARNGAVVEVDAGDYVGDTAVWTQNDLSLRAVGGRVRLIAAGKAVEGKGIWVVRAERVVVEGFDFSGAAVPDRNGAGIRLERGSLSVRDCSFKHNEMGILTSNDPAIVLEVQNSEFAYNRRPDGHNHNLYAGSIARLSVTGSYFHHAYVGHLLKSRAAVNHIAYNRLTDESDGSASYELEFPNGGVAYVIGNIIQQATTTQNAHVVSFGAEGYRWSSNELYLVNNTLVDGLQHGGMFARVSPGAQVVRIVNNLLIGKAGWNVGADAQLRHNPRVQTVDLEGPTLGDFRLRPDSSAWGQRVEVGSANGVPLDPQREYRHPRQSVLLQAPATQPGALQSPARPR